MRGWSRLLLISGLAGTGLAEPVPDVLDGARTTVQQWVQTRQVISRTRADWAADRELLEQSVALFERELAAIREQRSQVETNRVEVVRQREAASGEQAELLAGLEKVREGVAVLEERVRAMRPMFPIPLTERIQPLLDRLPADSSGTRLSPVQRLQTVITLLSEVDKFQGAITVGSEIRQMPGGGEVQVEVVYAGLGQAWFVNRDGTYAGVGVPAVGGWEWTTRNDLADAVRRVLRMYRNELPAGFVPLPIDLR